LAKKYAAFQACIALHKAGELNDNLLPIDSAMKIEEYNEVYFKHWEKYDELNGELYMVRVVFRAKVLKCETHEISEKFMKTWIFLGTFPAI
jgi:hypothetical protein